MKDGTFFKRHDKGSWAVSLNGVSRKDITTSDIVSATAFTEQHYDLYEGEPPYMHNALRGGKWVKVSESVRIESEVK
ncbi:hypothetical protein NVP1205O_37 [Vibrio phage 1.205.O._10N.222.51.A7]|nr:hypothetical protein NVP1205O_37 [Vibrio phage 1.205.O._10N.222.51.A7]